MSQREDLLAGAKRCIAEKGYFQATARDIAAVSGANLASIGYHFGSKDTLMNTAVLEMVDEWANTVESSVRESHADTPEQRMRTFVDIFSAAVERDRELQFASIQAFAQVQFDEEIRTPLAAAYLRGRKELAAMILGVTTEDVDADKIQGLGSLIHALSVGIVIQELLSPNSAPTGDQVLGALETVFRAHRTGESAPVPHQRGAAASPSMGGGPAKDEVDEAEEVACAGEIERLHRILRDWLSGDVAGTDTEFGEFADAHARAFTLVTADGVELGRDDVMEGLRQAHGSTPGLRIEIRDLRLVSASGPVVVATFTELHSGAPGARSRRCTVVFERDPVAPHGLRWRHLQETHLAG